MATVTLAAGSAGQRLDTALAEAMGVSRTRAAALIDAGAVRSMGEPLSRSLRVRGGEVVSVERSGVDPRLGDEPMAGPDAGIRGPGQGNDGGTGADLAAGVPGVEPVAEVGLDERHLVCVEDAFIVVDKPAGVAAHASPGWHGPTVVGGLTALGLPPAQVGAAEREGIVHRLDVGTSGLMVVARTSAAYTALKDQFRHREVAKAYQALVQGLPDPTRGTIDAPIDRHPRSRDRFAVVAGGRPSVTHYTVREAYRGVTLLDLELETGRTHQIRVHLSALRHPCVGDLRYGADPTLAVRLGLTRQWLHAVRLGFRDPRLAPRPGAAETGWWEFTSRPAADLQVALAAVQAD